MTVRIIPGDAITELAKLPEKSVHCCITSPPYFGLRDYGTATWEGGDEGCDHIETKSLKRDCSGGVSGGRDKGTRGEQPSSSSSVISYRNTCRKCGAVRIDQQMGLEDTPELYLEKMVAVFRGVWRVLRDDGTLWLNMGDTYANSGGDGSPGKTAIVGNTKAGIQKTTNKIVSGLKPKDLCGMPWRLAFALQADGWYLRSAAPWVKRSAMPESCTDRPSSALEYIFLLTKKPKYYYDSDAVRVISGNEASLEDYTKTDGRCHFHENDKTQGMRVTNPDYNRMTPPGGRNRRNSDAWFESVGMLMHGEEIVGFDVNPQGFKDAHFATFSPKLVEPMVKAGTSERGCCPECGAQWIRVVEKKPSTMNIRVRDNKKGIIKNKSGVDGKYSATDEEIDNYGPEQNGKSQTIGWRPGCKCQIECVAGFTTYSKSPEPVPCTILDPFAGALYDFGPVCRCFYNMPGCR